jgi:hypothetical protein
LAAVAVSTIRNNSVKILVVFITYVLDTFK